MFYFAWIEAPIDFDEVAHAVEDEKIVALEIRQEEGDFAALTIDVQVRPEGLLAAGRLQWCWLSWDDGSGIQPLFTGRLVAVPDSIDGEVMRLLFAARPENYESLKSDYATALRVLPYYDPVWVTGDTSDPDAVLSGYGATWHIDRTTLALSISDELAGEDGTIVIGPDDHTYNDLSISYADKPKLTVKFTGTLSWSQTGKGTIDLTERIVSLFRSDKSIYKAPHSGVISTLTGDGLISDWPQGGTAIDGGWTVNNDTSIVEADERIYKQYSYDVQYRGLAPSVNEDEITGRNFFLDSFADLKVSFPIAGLKQQTLFDWAADRKRQETLSFIMTADVQALVVDAPEDETMVTLTISAQDTVTEPGDDDAMPIVDKRRAGYLQTDRGASSVQYPLLLARAALRRGARAVEIGCRVPWALGFGATLRHNLQLTDRRLPGGVAFGKLTAYSLVASPSDGMYVDLTAACAIGRGGTVTQSDGNAVYAADGYMDTGYQVMAGATGTVPGLAGEIAYQSLDDYGIDDDGVNLFALDERSAVDELTLTGGLGQQINIVTAAAADPVQALKDWPSRVCLQLVPVADQNFYTLFPPTITPLPIPQGVNLEAAAP